MICPNANAPFISCWMPADQLSQRVFHYLDQGAVILVDSVSRAGSIWNRTCTDTIGLIDDVSDWHVRIPGHAVGFSDAAIAIVHRPASASDTIGFTDSFVSAGTCVYPESVELVDALFTSDTKKGMAVYVDGHETCDLAQADAIGTTKAVGLATTDVAIGTFGQYQTEGTITLADWTPVTGAAALTPGAYYYLSEAVAGQLTSTAPTTDTQFVVAIARALSTTKLDVEISQPILL